MRNATLHPTHAAKGQSNRTATLCVVDPHRNEYQRWAAAQADGVQVEIVGTAEEALRVARSQQVDLWVVNTQLPGISGSELCTMLKARSKNATVCLVADEYSPAAERSALAARATWFICKPAHLAGIDHWLAERSASSAQEAANAGSI